MEQAGFSFVSIETSKKIMLIAKNETYNQIIVSKLSLI